MKQCKALSDDRYQEIRKALDMGPTPGPWVAGKNSMAVNFRFVTDRGGDIVAYCDRSKNEAMANASFIAACEPDTIRALLEERDALREARNWKRIAEDATHVEREELTRLRSLLRALLHDVKFAISSGDWRVDGRCDPTITIERAEEALAAEGEF